MSMPSKRAWTPNVLGLARLVGDLRGVQQRLGRDAPAVQAGAADLVLLDQRDALAELGRSQRAGVAAAAAAENDDVVPVAARPPQECSSVLLTSRRPGRPARLQAPVGRHVRRAICTRVLVRGSGAALGCVPMRRPSRCRPGPAMSRCAQGTPAGTNSRRNSPATSMPPLRSPATLARSATAESRPLRSSSGSGIGQIGLAGPAGGVDHRVAERVVVGHHAGRPRCPSATICAPVSVATSMSTSGESGRRPGEGVGEHQPSLGVGVEHLDGLAAVHREHVGRALGGPARHVLGERQVADHAHRQAERRRSPHRGQHRGGAAHVGLHRRPSPWRRLERQAAGVEGDALADQHQVPALASAGRTPAGPAAAGGPSPAPTPRMPP